MRPSLLIPRRLSSTLMTVIIAAVAGAAAMGGVAYATSQAPSNVIHGCYDNKGGRLRVVDVTAHCKQSETAIQWNKTGPAGSRGPTGPPGPTGPAGPPSGSKDKISKPADGATQSTQGTLSGFSTAWVGTVAVESGQAVRIEVTVSWMTSNVVSYFGLQRGSTLIFTTGAQYLAGGGGLTQTMHFEWVDDSPGTGDVTYQVLGAANTGGLTLKNGVGAALVSTTGEAGSCMLLEAFTPL